MNELEQRVAKLELRISKLTDRIQELEQALCDASPPVLSPRHRAVLVDHLAAKGDQT